MSEETTTDRDARRSRNMAHAERMALALANATGRVFVVTGTLDEPRVVDWGNTGDGLVLGVARPDMTFWGVMARLAVIAGALALLRLAPWW